MATKLVIVESPTKARTISKVLGRAYQVRASGGHVRDLPKTKLGIDTENGFEPQYLVSRDKTKTVKDLRELVQSASTVYLATDPDREGEAIAWHIAEATNARGGGRLVQRISFHEITPEAIREAVAHPREIDMQLVNAQQARRLLDRLVGYKLSPLLWKKVQRGLSAGRVQSVAVRLVVEREREIEAFVPVEYWTIEADFCKEDAAHSVKTRKDGTFHATLQAIRGKKPELNTQADAEAVIRALQGASYVVESVKRREGRRNAAPPFITSTLQQEAARKLNFTARRTMQIAQQLYEGVEVGGEGAVGLITYMRTDSTQVAMSAQDEARTVIAARYGREYLPASAPQYTKKVRGAQEAHEAIRPTSPGRDPDSLTAHLTGEQLRLYRLIWQRFIASQMAPALLDQTTVDIGGGPATAAAPRPYTFRATGSVIKFAGFLAVYREGQDAGDAQDDLDKKALPPLAERDPLTLIKLSPDQHFTEPPPRYTEATLVKTLEEKGIGRPSTYAPILSTVQDRGYVEKTDKKFVPTPLGRVVNDLLVEQFPDVVDVGFTSQMEEELDDVAEGAREWRRVLGEFYGPFEIEIARAEREVAHITLDKPEPERLGEACPECGKDLLIRTSRFGPFVACAGFPTCRYKRSIPKLMGVACPICHVGQMVEKRSGRGKVFYSCDRYPACTFSVWNRPLPGACPQCGGLIMQGARGEGAKCSQCAWASKDVPADTGQPPINNGPIVAATPSPAARQAPSTTRAPAAKKPAAAAKKPATAKKPAAVAKKPAAVAKKPATAKKSATPGTRGRVAAGPPPAAKAPRRSARASDLDDLFEPTGS
ncbi:MAG TPA: type I DNA topoisomerase [Chloroflexia bacterium]|nr:type I DNA topoisomerase [Chloroflexia bacterium]